MARKYLKGLNNFRFWPVTTDDETTYAVGTMVLIPGAQSLSKATTRSDTVIYADDVSWDTISDYQHEDLTLTVIELPLEIMAMLDGANYDETTGVYTATSTASAPMIAFGYSALRGDGTYRMYKHYVGKLVSMSVSHATKSDSGDGQPYEIVLRMSARMADKVPFSSKDSESVDTSWLDTIDTIPVTP